MSRFDHIKYDEKTENLQSMLKQRFVDVEVLVNALADGRAKSLAHTKLEEAFMWVGKALRDEQIKRNNETTLNESRG